MPEYSISLGDVVMLKSGGPLMTVDSIKTMIEGQISCCWIDESGEPHFELFCSLTLKKAEADLSADSLRQSEFNALPSRIQDLFNEGRISPNDIRAMRR
jgi:uncharacterized protein YodC (DUF2158 family)